VRGAIRRTEERKAKQEGGEERDNRETAQVSWSYNLLRAKAYCQTIGKNNGSTVDR